MDDLTARLEAAEKGSRELDGRMFCWRYNFVFNRVQIGSTIQLFYNHRDGAGQVATGFPFYTTSLDAALPGENITLACIYDREKGIWRAVNEADGIETYGFAKTEALARRIAALKARRKLKDLY
ncbi:MAG: hypothetical protein ACE5HV_00015 [Acidobacteriota bacterium]